MKKRNNESPKLDRKIVERNRRIHMKDLCSKLASLIPPHHFNSKETLSQHDQLDRAASYIKKLNERIEKLKRIKEKAKLKSTEANSTSAMDRTLIGLRLPMVELKDFGSSIEVVLISGLKKNFMFYEVIGVLGDEGAEVVSASFSTVGDKVFHTIHAQVRISRVGVETTRVCQRLQELVY